MGMSLEERKEANREASARWRAKNPEKARDSLNRWRAKNPEKVKMFAAKWEAENPKKKKAHNDRWEANNPEKYLLKAAKIRAKRKGLPFSITVEDIVIPDKCPVLGTSFERCTPYAASLDRIIPKLGYVPGNVQIISRRANILKRDASLDEIQAIADWLRRIMEKK